MTAGRKTNASSHNWCTPAKYVNAVKSFFDGSIDLDPCSNDYSIVGAKIEFRLPKDDGLSLDWNYQKIYVNPPYGRDKDRGTSIKDWLKKCCEVHLQNGAEVIALIPVASNTAHWKKYVFTKATAICFLSDTRLKFLENGKEGGKGAPMACAIVYYGSNYHKFYDYFNHFGAIVNISIIQ